MKYKAIKGKDDTLLFSTGVRDRNDQEIYEGDVILYHSSHSDIFSGLVRFEDGEFYCVNEPYRSTLRSLGMRQVLEVTVNTRLSYSEFSGRNFEVVGNIYDNPSLLMETTLKYDIPSRRKMEISYVNERVKEYNNKSRFYRFFNKIPDIYAE